MKNHPEIDYSRIGRIDIFEKADRRDTVVKTSAGTHLLIRDWTEVPACGAVLPEETEMWVEIDPLCFTAFYEDGEEYRALIDSDRNRLIPYPHRRRRFTSEGETECIRAVINGYHTAETLVLLSDDSLLMVRAVVLEFDCREGHNAPHLKLLLCKESFHYEREVAAVVVARRWWRSK